MTLLSNIHTAWSETTDLYILEEREGPLVEGGAPMRTYIELVVTEAVTPY